MATYFVHFNVYASICIEVEAENEEEAREKAETDAWPPSLCHHCSDNIDIGDVGEITEITRHDE